MGIIRTFASKQTPWSETVGVGCTVQMKSECSSAGMFAYIAKHLLPNIRQCIKDKGWNWIFGVVHIWPPKINNLKIHHKINGCPLNLWPLTFWPGHIHNYFWTGHLASQNRIPFPMSFLLAATVLYSVYYWITFLTVLVQAVENIDLH